mgnify:CR=1 FL=1
MTHEFTCKKHGPVTGRLFASGDVLCPKCLEEMIDPVFKKETDEAALRDAGFLPVVPTKKEW